MTPCNLSIVGVASRIGKLIPVDDWAHLMKMPTREGGGFVNGALVKKVTGIESKAWEPEFFKDIRCVVDVACEAIASSGLTASQIDAVLVVTCTPYEILLDQDSFRILREIGIRDDVAPIQIGAGCAGVVRAVQIAAGLRAENTLVITYNAPSVIGVTTGGELPPQYKVNGVHPFANVLWLSSAIFSDAAAAVVLSRNGSPKNGLAFYSRDSQSFGDEPGFSDPLVYYPGGGLNRPAGTKDSVELSAYGMSGEAIKVYYRKGMLLNHANVRHSRPNYVNEVARIYTHQASPALVEDFVELAQLPRDKVPTHARTVGNLVSPCTLKLLHDDISQGKVKRGDEICVMVVGAGPERGGFILPVEKIDRAKP